MVGPPINTISNPRVNCLDTAEWTKATAASVIAVIAQICQAQDSCSVMLTGGRSAERLYKAWAALPEFSQMCNVHFYFGDERCVPPGHPESNYGMVMRTLFKRGIPQACTVTRMAAEQADHEAAAAAYAQQLPGRIDVLLLSVGEDGHIASLFPRSPALLETYRRVVHVHALKLPTERLTITPPVIEQSANVFVLALGSAKASVFLRALTEPDDILDLPVRLALNATWFFDTQLIN